MKKLILAAFALTTAASVFAQGTILLGNRFTTAPAQTTHVYAPLSPTDTTPVVGLATGDTPAGGTTDFGGRLLIGAAAGGGLDGQYGAATTLAQFVAARGAGVDLGSLSPVGQTTTFRTGTGAGFIVQIPSTIAQFEEAEVGPFTFSIVAWDNFSGLYPTWEAAKPAWLAGTIAAGMMTPFTVNSLGGGITPAVQATQAGQVLTSFNLYYASVIPEPSSFALVGLGAAAMLIFRRRN